MKTDDGSKTPGRIWGAPQLLIALDLWKILIIIFFWKIKMCFFNQISFIYENLFVLWNMINVFVMWMHNLILLITEILFSFLTLRLSLLWTNVNLKVKSHYNFFSNKLSKTDYWLMLVTRYFWYLILLREMSYYI